MKQIIFTITLLALLLSGCAGQREHDKAGDSEPRQPEAEYMLGDLKNELAEKKIIVVRKYAPPLQELRAQGYVGGIAAYSRTDQAEHLIPITGGEGFNTESYDHLEENPFLAVELNPLSTFSIDVDTASYSNMRRFLRQGTLPPPGAVRIEELVNYFRYDYPSPTGGAPFAVNVEIGDAPWAPRHRLVLIGLKGEEMPADRRPPGNLVFLLDVSGSMQSPNKLPLLKSAMKMLVNTLTGQDSVSIVVYAGAAGLVLPATPADNRQAILEAIENLRTGGSTAGGAGIRLAYDTARANFIPGGINRVILATDGDFNIGVTNQSELVRLIEREAAGGTFLTVLGFGMGNLKDSTLEKLADHGNGNYGYIDNRLEARKMLVEQIGATLMTIAKDVKIQVEFNPRYVAAFRLIGYENRMLRSEDFNDDRKDAGEIGAGHTVTALYELVPAGLESGLPIVDDLKYRGSAHLSDAADSGELLTLKIRYKEPAGSVSRLLSFPIVDDGISLASTSGDFKFAAAVASFGMILRHSEHSGEFTLHDAAELAREGVGADRFGYRGEFIDIVESAERMTVLTAQRD